MVWDKSRDRTLGVVVDPPLAAAGPDAFAWPDPAACPAYAEAKRNRERFPDRLRMLSIGFSLFERAWTLTGMERLLCLMHEDPSLVHALLDRITAWNLGVIRRCAPLGIDAVYLGDDWGSQHGPLFSPKAWTTFIVPHLAATCAEAHRLGLLVSLHCCGNVAPLMGGIADAGVDVFDPFQPEAMDIAQLRRQYRERIAFWGGLSVQRTLPHGTPDEVRAETRRLLREIAPGGGYILSPSHSVTGDVPPENVLAFLAPSAAVRGSRSRSR